MPRPPDTYTHSQFESIDPDNLDGQAETARCVHCRQWQGNIKALNRKKEHLMKCPPYAAWRASGNGQDVPPPNRYTAGKSNKRARDSLNAGDENDQQYYAPFGDYGAADYPGPQYTPVMVKPKNPDINKAYEEFFDDTHNISRVRCRHCGFTRAKNSTRQVEHLISCQEFLGSADGQAAAANGELDSTPSMPQGSQGNEIWRGKIANPNLSASRRGRGRGGAMAASTPRRPMPPPGPPRPVPSLANHLLGRDAATVTSATQQPFLSHAGCGTLSSPALLQWLTQDAHISRGFINFIGSLIGKVRLPETGNTQQDTTYRAMDLLISTLNNVRREMSFFEVTASKYGLQVGGEEPKPATKAYLDLFASASSPSASLLEGMVVLWATEHFYRTSWAYANSFTNTAAPTSQPYALPSYLTNSQGDISNPFGPNPGSSTNNEAHINAMHQALIPNWTSPAFSKFVDACRAIVDELANAQTSGNGRQEMSRCESVFRQIIWVWERIWPDVNGMGEEDELAAEREKIAASATPNSAGKQPASASRANGSAHRVSNAGEPIEVNDDDDADRSGDQDAQGEESADSPYGGTGLGAVHAANQAP